MTSEHTSLILQELLTDESIAFRVHNVKISKLSDEVDLPQMFLAHYSSLDEEIRASTPLSDQLLRHINQMMNANQASTLLGLPAGTIRPAHHIKINGTAVIAHHDLSIALHLSFTNTAKSSQAVYGQDTRALIETQANAWQFAGNVNLLHKSSKHILISQDLHDQQLTIEPSDGYIRLPNSHALATTHTLNTLKHTAPSQLIHLQQAIIEKIMATFDEQQEMNG